MKDKRISLRFRMDNELDSKAWKILETLATERNISKNAVVIDLILSGGVHTDSVDELVERVAVLVADKLKKELSCIPMSSGASGEAESDIHVNTEKKDSVSRADEPELLSEEALDFLAVFG